MRVDDEVPLRAESVGVERGGRKVLSDVGAEFAARTVTAVVGPSGAGKTSLLRCLNRLDEVTEGRVVLDGVDVRTIEPTALRRRVGMIFQTPVLFEGGVRANLAYGLSGVPEDELAGALERAGLEPAFLSRESSALSVGQAQRVCIARALLRDPEVLLMDEPTSALDRNAAARIESLLGRLTQEGLAIVLVTHNLAQAERVAQRAVLLIGGRVAGTGIPGELEEMWPPEGSR